MVSEKVERHSRVRPCSLVDMLRLFILGTMDFEQRNNIMSVNVCVLRFIMFAMQGTEQKVTKSVEIMAYVSAGCLR